MKLKKALSTLLALVLLLSCMSITAFADGETELAASHTTWTAGENLKVSSNLTMSGPVTVTGNVTLTIAEGAELIIKGSNGSDGSDSDEAPGGNGGKGGDGLTITSGTLTINGAGTLAVTGGDGGKGGYKNDDDVSDGGAGSNGGNGITGGSITIDGGNVVCQGGTGGLDGTAKEGTESSHGYNGVGLSAKVTMTAGKLQAGSNNLSSGSSFSGGIMNFEVPATYVANGYACVANTDSATSSTYFYMVEKFPAITNSAPKADEATNHGYITVSAESAMENAEITVTAYPADGYKLDSLTYTPEGGSAMAITDGSFNMPDKAVTVSATFSMIVTTGENIDLDLEDSTDYPDSTTIDQYYTKAEASSTVYNNKIKVEWSNDTMSIKVANAKKWNPSTLAWETDPAKNGVATVDGETNKTTYTLTNYSAKAFTCNLTFAADSAVEGKFTSCAVGAENVELAAVVNDITKPDVKLDASVPTTATITATITPELEGDGSFASADATTSPVKYGTFTISCTAVNN